MKIEYEKPEICICLIGKRENIITTSNDYELPIVPAVVEMEQNE